MMTITGSAAHGKNGSAAQTAIAAGPALQAQLNTLKSHAIDDFSRKAIDGAMSALNDNVNPLRLNFFSTAMRIMFEHMMEKLSPPDDVARSPWYKSERDNGKPTRGQRIVFAIQGGLKDDFVKKRT